MKHPVSPRSRVTLHLSLTLEDGTVAESTFGAEPFTFTMGDGSLVRGLEIALYGLVPGARQRLQLEPEQTWGPRDPQRVHSMPRAAFDAGLELAPGVIVGFETPDGEELAGTVLEAGEHDVRIDFNHPLAGHSVIYDVEILEVVPADEQDEDAG
jgi:FKBP-type peptidyl-prolyl cis-trans isomerase SlpA